MSDPSDVEKLRQWYRLSPEALLRYQVVSEIRAQIAIGKSLAEAVSTVLNSPLRIALDGSSVELTRRSTYRWFAAFRDKGIEGLEQVRGRSRPLSKALPQPLLDFLRDEKAMDRYASVPELIRRARERGVIGSDQAIDRVTVYRACRRMELPLRRLPAKHESDQRRFAYPHRMMMVLADGKHFRAGLKRSRRVVLFFLDDASRFGLAAVVGTSECTELFLRGLHRVIERFGFIDSLFLDRGPGFSSDETHLVCVNLQTNLILGTAAYPEGRGKIERFNQTAGAQLLRGLQGADVDDTPAALETRIEHFLLERYNHTLHESLDKQTPHDRFHADSRALRFPPSETHLRDRFVATFTRRVSNDNVVSIDSVDYEVPRGHARVEVDVYRRLLSGELLVLHDGKLVTLHPVDLSRNAYDRRARSAPSSSDLDQGVPTTAAALAFARDLGPVVDPDGGFADPLRRRPRKEF